MALPSPLHDMTGLGRAGLSGGVRRSLRRRSMEALEGMPDSEKQLHAVLQS